MNALRACAIAVMAFCSIAYAASDFSIQSIQCGTNSQITIAWPVVSNKTYYVQSTDSLTNLWQDFPDGQLTAGTNDSILSYADTTATGVLQRFYRVKTDRTSPIMVLVLDRSGSMVANGGAAVFPNAVSAFLSYFSDTTDKAGMVSFGTLATVDVPVSQPFKTTISNAVSHLAYGGYTFSQGGLTDAFAQIQSVPVLPGETPSKAVVFFTDGGANVVQDTLNCGSPALWDFTGGDAPQTAINFYNPTNGVFVGTKNGGGVQFCPASTTFPSLHGAGGTLSFTADNVRAEAQDRTIQTADDMRGNGITVYAIGLGTSVNALFLQIIANDPASLAFDPSKPAGKAVIAVSAGDLLQAFQQVAAQIHATAGP